MANILRRVMRGAMIAVITLGAAVPSFAAGEEVKVAIISRTFFYMPLWVATREGFMRDEGLDVQILIEDNSDHVNDLLRKGEVQLTLRTLSNATTIPAGAVNQGPKGAFAFVVGPDNKVVMRPLKVALTQGPVAVITSGVSPGETVVVDGQMTLKPGSLVRVKPAAPAEAPAR